VDPIVVLLDLTRHLASEETLEHSLQAVTDSALALVDSDHASIRLLDDARATLLCGARSGLGTDRAPLTFKPNEGIAGWVVEHGDVVRLADVAADSRFEHRDNQGFDVGSMMAVPLWSAGRVIGVLSVSHGEKSHFEDRDELLARLLANCAVPAIERARLERLATTDAHTRAFNRRYLVPRLEEEMARAKRQKTALSLLMMDLDHFKRVNDQHGHAAGDQVLREFADRVRAATRVQDALVRWGGEEFVLVMPDTDAERATHVAERIREAVSGLPIVLDDGVELRQSVSIGVASWNRQEPVDAFVARSDEALYDAKRTGRNRVSTIPD
jgi:diguanylate cyclase (GGDEF)-like protein